MVPKLSRHAFTRFWDLHAWSGVLGGLVLHVMFLAGAITLFHEQLEVWQDPYAQRAAPEAKLAPALTQALASLDTPPRALWIEPPSDGLGTPKVSYQAESGEWTSAWVDAERGVLVPERERLAGFLYSIHFLWHDAIGEWLYYVAGMLAALFLLAIVTGVLIHSKDLARQFHQFRPEKSKRVLFSDMHKVLGVMGLPFQLLYAYTGALIVLGPLLLKGFVGPVFGGDEQRAELFAEGHVHPTEAKPGAPVDVLSTDELVERVRRLRPDADFRGYEVAHPGRVNGLFEAWGKDHGTPALGTMVRLQATDGTVLDDGKASGGVSGSARRWIQGLHYADFGGLPLRFAFFVLALASCATILTGNWVWLARRESREPSTGNRVLSRLTTGIGAGAVVAVAALFLASRLFPLDLSHRGTWEELVFVGTLALCVVWVLLAKDERDLAWQLVGLAGALFLPVPFLAANFSRAGLFGAGPRLAPVVGVDLALLTVGLASCTAALALRRGATSTARSRTEVGHA